MDKINLEPNKHVDYQNRWRYPLPIDNMVRTKMNNVDLDRKLLRVKLYE